MTENTISHALKDIRQRITRAAHKAHRAETDISLVAVSKFHPRDSVEAALQAGQRLFGENRVQEAASKFPPLRELWPDLKLHLIGGLQTNKAVEACRLADVIESLDRPSLSEALDKASQKVGHLPELLIQVNTGNEPQKFGIPLQEADIFIENNLKRFGSHVKGLMAIPPQHEDPQSHFRTLTALSRRHGLTVLSMGMSADFEEAIAEGATLVRVGSAIFGTRPPFSTDKTL
ncbi:YggS family pyridoxal phosphate-dependent enzyme [Saccharibacter sp. 17.LH.SD]|uniref:YggS family pyridoxal phosphate-dependent enzyme n=1 Tax=Saccharibacter sp. 17.LH.SD TaxID=2689393 RepID=UPI00136DFD10|nr:YggS family pyridoxal phosphate-dependent enzyme [Saccharibacter sp. 17.LH.SD]MXV43867.1 YggS family pyridoxal phosphate-dependent enzyme [Saccharibacter sp. 17.LH.SD]